MKSLYHTFLYQPILGALVFIYNSLAFGDLGLAIIILTIVIRIVLFPLLYKGAKQQALMQKIQPKLKEIQEKHKDNKERQAMELMALYKKHKINPFSSILSLFIQIPILIAIYQVLLKEAGGAIFDNFLFLGFINLREINLVIAVIAAVFQYIQIKMSMPKNTGGKNENPMAGMSKAMLYIGPGLTLLFLSRFPAALGVYWLTSTVFGIGQQVLINKSIRKEEEKEMGKEVKEELQEIHEDIEKQEK
ncbi:MAG: YidC/Oxa1 family membrane protein insertase [bacterium]|nr:YidC/Oxa1 family membrane protein insertase [bacterium]